jgi:leucyl aminopeptidase
VQAAAEGLTLGDWSFDDLRGEAGRKKLNPPPGRGIVLTPEPVPEAEAAAARGRIIADAQNYARGLVARPGNVATPRFLAAQAERLAEELGMRVQTWGPERLRELGFGALLAVARGSSQEPRFILLEHRGAEGPPYVVVGKGVTFDSGGISLKPPAGMADMKYDMAGAAAVFGTLKAAAELELPQRVIGLIPATENMPSAEALKPGDVIRGLAGISIEVDNTDAEGRLILSDALAYADRLKPRAVVDLATLTGACVIALGHHAIGMMTPDDSLADALTVAGMASGERVWRLPLWREYRKQLDSDIADIKNVGGRPASTITAGLFLKEFVGDFPWAHLDIAGTAWTDEQRPYNPKGATGIGVRLLIEWLRRAQ